MSVLDTKPNQSFVNIVDNQQVNSEDTFKNDLILDNSRLLSVNDQIPSINYQDISDAEKCLAYSANESQVCQISHTDTINKIQISPTKLETHHKIEDVKKELLPNIVTSMSSDDVDALKPIPDSSSNELTLIVNADTSNKKSTSSFDNMLNRENNSSDLSKTTVEFNPLLESEIIKNPLNKENNTTDDTAIQSYTEVTKNKLKSEVIADEIPRYGYQDIYDAEKQLGFINTNKQKDILISESPLLYDSLITECTVENHHEVILTPQVNSREINMEVVNIPIEAQIQTTESDSLSASSDMAVSLDDKLEKLEVHPVFEEPRISYHEISDAECLLATASKCREDYKKIETRKTDTVQEFVENVESYEMTINRETAVKIEENLLTESANNALKSEPTNHTFYEIPRFNYFDLYDAEKGYAHSFNQQKILLPLLGNTNVSVHSITENITDEIMIDKDSTVSISDVDASTSQIFEPIRNDDNEIQSVELVLDKKSSTVNIDTHIHPNILEINTERNEVNKNLNVNKVPAAHDSMGEIKWSENISTISHVEINASEPAAITGIIKSDKNIQDNKVNDVMKSVSGVISTSEKPIIEQTIQFINEESRFSCDHSKNSMNVTTENPKKLNEIDNSFEVDDLSNTPVAVVYGLNNESASASNVDLGDTLTVQTLKENAKETFSDDDNSFEIVDITNEMDEIHISDDLKDDIVMIEKDELVLESSIEKSSSKEISTELQAIEKDSYEQNVFSYEIDDLDEKLIPVVFGSIKDVEKSILVEKLKLVERNTTVEISGCESISTDTDNVEIFEPESRIFTENILQIEDKKIDQLNNITSAPLTFDNSTKPSTISAELIETEKFHDTQNQIIDDISTDTKHRLGINDVVTEQFTAANIDSTSVRPEKSPIHSLHDLLPEIDSIPEFKPSFSNTVLYSKLSVDAPEFTPSYMYQSVTKDSVLEPSNINEKVTTERNEIQDQDNSNLAPKILEITNSSILETKNQTEVTKEREIITYSETIPTKENVPKELIELKSKRNKKKKKKEDKQEPVKEITPEVIESPERYNKIEMASKLVNVWEKPAEDGKSYADIVAEGFHTDKEMSQEIVQKPLDPLKYFETTISSDYSKLDEQPDEHKDDKIDSWAKIVASNRLSPEKSQNVETHTEKMIPVDKKTPMILVEESISDHHKHLKVELEVDEEGFIMVERNRRSRSRSRDNHSRSTSNISQRNENREKSENRFEAFTSSLKPDEAECLQSSQIEEEKQLVRKGRKSRSSKSREKEVKPQVIDTIPSTSDEEKVITKKDKKKRSSKLKEVNTQPIQESASRTRLTSNSEKDDTLINPSEHGTKKKNKKKKKDKHADSKSLDNIDMPSPVELILPEQEVVSKSQDVTDNKLQQTHIETPITTPESIQTPIKERIYSEAQFWKVDPSKLDDFMDVSDVISVEVAAVSQADVQNVPEVFTGKIKATKVEGLKVTEELSLEHKMADLQREIEEMLLPENDSSTISENTSKEKTDSQISMDYRYDELQEDSVPSITSPDPQGTQVETNPDNDSKSIAAESKIYTDNDDKHISMSIIDSLLDETESISITETQLNEPTQESSITQEDIIEVISPIDIKSDSRNESTQFTSFDTTDKLTSKYAVDSSTPNTVFDTNILNLKSDNFWTEKHSVDDAEILLLTQNFPTEVAKTDIKTICKSNIDAVYSNINEGKSVQEIIFNDTIFWPDKHIYHDAECQYFLSMAIKLKTTPPINKNVDNKDQNDKDKDPGGSSGHSSDVEEPKGHHGSPFDSDYLAMDLPGGVCSWKDHSSYLSVETPNDLMSGLPSDDKTIREDILTTSPKDPVAPSSPKQEPAESDSTQRTAKEFSKDIESLLEEIKSVQTRLTDLPDESLDTMEQGLREGIEILVKCEEASDLLEQKIMEYRHESEVQTLMKELIVMKARISKLLTQARQGLTTIQDVRVELAQQKKQIEEQKEKIAKLDSWLESINNGLIESNKQIDILSEEDVLRYIEIYEKYISEYEEYEILLSSITVIRTAETSLSMQEKLNAMQNAMYQTKNLVIVEIERLRQLLLHLRSAPEVADDDISQTDRTIDSTSMPEEVVEVVSGKTLLSLNQEVSTKIPTAPENLDLLPVQESKTSHEKAKVEVPKVPEQITSVAIETQTGQSLLLKSPPVTDKSLTYQPEDKTKGVEINVPEIKPCKEKNVQTGASLLLDEPLVANKPEVITTKDVCITCAPPREVEVQTSQPQSEEKNMLENIQVTQTVSSGHETIEIASRPVLRDQKIEENTLLVGANYSDSELKKDSQLTITHSLPQSFETIMVEPDETTTEVVVDADGTKRIIVKKVRKTLVTRQQTVQTQQQREQTLSVDGVPQKQSFSQITLKEDKGKTSTTINDKDIQHLQYQTYGGQIVTSIPGGEITIQEFTSKPETVISMEENLQPEEILQLAEGQIPTQIQTSSSSVTAVVQQVTKRTIQTRRRIIRKIVIIDGKEHVTEEVIEEPDNIEVFEEQIPRVSINIKEQSDTRKDGGDRLQDKDDRLPPLSTHPDKEMMFQTDIDNKSNKQDDDVSMDKPSPKHIEEVHQTAINIETDKDNLHEVVNKFIEMEGKQSSDTIPSISDKLPAEEREKTPVSSVTVSEIIEHMPSEGSHTVHDTYLVQEPQDGLQPSVIQGIFHSTLESSSTNISTVVQKVTRKIIRTKRRIIKHIKIIDGKEHVTEEVIEEPDDVEIFEDEPKVEMHHIQRDGVKTKRVKIIKQIQIIDGKEHVTEQILEEPDDEYVPDSTITAEIDVQINKPDLKEYDDKNFTQIKPDVLTNLPTQEKTTTQITSSIKQSTGFTQLEKIEESIPKLENLVQKGTSDNAPHVIDQSTSLTPIETPTDSVAKQDNVLEEVTTDNVPGVTDPSTEFIQTEQLPESIAKLDNVLQKVTSDQPSAIVSATMKSDKSREHTLITEAPSEIETETFQKDLSLFDITKRFIDSEMKDTSISKTIPKQVQKDIGLPISLEFIRDTIDITKESAKEVESAVSEKLNLETVASTLPSSDKEIELTSEENKLVLLDQQPKDSNEEPSISTVTTRPDEIPIDKELKHITVKTTKLEPSITIISETTSTEPQHDSICLTKKDVMPGVTDETLTQKLEDYTLTSDLDISDIDKNKLITKKEINVPTDLKHGFDGSDNIITEANVLSEPDKQEIAKSLSEYELVYPVIKEETVTTKNQENNKPMISSVKEISQLTELSVSEDKSARSQVSILNLTKELLEKETLHAGIIHSPVKLIESTISKDLNQPESDEKSKYSIQQLEPITITEQSHSLGLNSDEDMPVIETKHIEKQQVNDKLIASESVETKIDLLKIREVADTNLLPQTDMIKISGDLIEHGFTQDVEAFGPTETQEHVQKSESDFTENAPIHHIISDQGLLQSKVAVEPLKVGSIMTETDTDQAQISPEITYIRQFEPQVQGSSESVNKLLAVFEQSEDKLTPSQILQETPGTEKSTFDKKHVNMLLDSERHDSDLRGSQIPRKEPYDTEIKKPQQTVDITMSISKIDEDKKMQPKLQLDLQFEQSKDSNVPTVVKKDINVHLPSDVKIVTEHIKVPAVESFENDQIESEVIPEKSIKPQKRSKHKKKHKKGSESSDSTKVDISIADTDSSSLGHYVDLPTSPPAESPKPTEDIFKTISVPSKEIEEIIEESLEPLTTTDNISNIEISEAIEVTSVAPIEMPKSPEELEVEPESSAIESEYIIEEKGYEPEDISQGPLSTPDKKKKQKKRKSNISEDTTYPKLSTTDSDDTSLSMPDEVSKPLQTKKAKDKKHKKKILVEPLDSTEPDQKHKPESPKIGSEIVESSPKDESYHTMSEASDISTVKIVEECVQSSPEASKEVHTTLTYPVSIMEEIATQEYSIQTSPEQTKSVEEEPRPETLDSNLQTSPITVVEALIQTTPVEEKEANTQTLQEETIIEKTSMLDSEIQTSRTETPEQIVQFEATTQVIPYDISGPEEKFSQTTPPIEEPDMEKLISTEVEKETREMQTSPTPIVETKEKSTEIVIETTETDIQTTKREITDQETSTTPVKEIEVTHTSIQTPEVPYVSTCTQSDEPESIQKDLDVKLSKTPNLEIEQREIITVDSTQQTSPRVDTVGSYLPKLELSKPEVITVDSMQQTTPTKELRGTIPEEPKIDTVDSVQQTTPRQPEMNKTTVSLDLTQKEIITADSTQQTSPRVYSEDSISTSTDEPYEVHLRAQISIPHNSDFLETERQFQESQQSIISEKYKPKKRKPKKKTESQLLQSPESLSDPINTELSLSITPTSDDFSSRDTSSIDEGISHLVSPVITKPSHNILTQQKLTYSDVVQRSKSKSPSPSKSIPKKSDTEKLLDTLERRTHSAKQFKYSTPDESMIITSLEPSLNKSYDLVINDKLDLVRNAVADNDVVTIEKNIIIVIETISIWLEEIQYKIQKDTVIESKPMQETERLKILQSHINTLKEIVDVTYINEEIITLIETLTRQVNAVNTLNSETSVNIKEIEKEWYQFLKDTEKLNISVERVKSNLDNVILSDMPTLQKLDKIDIIEIDNNTNFDAVKKMFKRFRSIVEANPKRECPSRLYDCEDDTKQLENAINNERDRLLQLTSLAEEYEQTLQDFGQITEVAEALLDGKIIVSDLNHLREEIQKHRTFFVNLSHCRAILESLEDNLDIETRSKYASLHNSLKDRATVIIDRAASRAQQMTLAASRWTLLEQGMKAEQQWLIVAKQRVPDLSNVTSMDHEQYINLYQSISLDASHHYAKMLRLLSITEGLQNLIVCSGIESQCSIALDTLVKLQEDVDSRLTRLTAFKENWITYDNLVDRIEAWIKVANRELEFITSENVTATGNLRRFWELKAQHEVYNNLKNESGVQFEKALEILPISDEMVQRQFFSKIEDKWRDLATKIGNIHTSAIQNISDRDVSSGEKLNILEEELRELRSSLDGLKGVVRSEDELNLYIERLQVMTSRIDRIQNELGRLSLLPTAESDRLGALLTQSGILDDQISEELERSLLLKEKILQVQSGIIRCQKSQRRARLTLEECEAAELLGSDVVERASETCDKLMDDLASQWRDILALRQALHALPTSLRVCVSPTGVEKEITALQETHSDLESACGALSARLRSKVQLWRRYERQLELVQGAVREADYMVELLTVQGQVDYDRLLKATEKLETLSESLNRRSGELVGELKDAAAPLEASTDPTVAAQLRRELDDAATAYEHTCSNLTQLCDKYNKAVDLWKRYRDAAATVRAFTDQQEGRLHALRTDDAPNIAQACLEQEARVAELRSLASRVAEETGSRALQADADALARRLQLVAGAVQALADLGEARQLARAKAQHAKEQMCDMRQDLAPVHEDGEIVEDKLIALRDNLIALGKSEANIAPAKAELPEIDRDVSNEHSIVRILELWQAMFRDTFLHYHRLSTALVRSGDAATALRLWHEYLLDLQSFLLGTVPADYENLTEHRRLCRVHKNLLTSQRSILMNENRESRNRDLADKFDSLTNLHNETLARIVERHDEVCTRISAWDDYREIHTELLRWLKEMEREKEKLQLRYIHIKRIQKVLSKLQNLSDKVPEGKKQADKLLADLKKILQFTEETYGASVRMEYAGLVKRVDNLQASLDTWQDFLTRIIGIIGEYDKLTNDLHKLFAKTQDELISHTEEDRLSRPQIKKAIEKYTELRTKVEKTESQIETLSIIQEQLKECLSPQDIRLVNQKVWQLRQQRADLEHQLSIIIHRLQERLEVHVIYETRLTRFVEWMTTVESRLESSSQSSNISALDPQDLIRRINSDVQAETAMKEREFEWLSETGSTLVEISKKDEKSYSKHTSKQLKEVQERWYRLQETGRSRIAKITELLETITQLEERLTEIRLRLHTIESKLSITVVLEYLTTKAVDEKFRDRDDIHKDIESESGEVGEALNLCDLVFNDPDILKGNFDLRNLKTGVDIVEKKWKSICDMSELRKNSLKEIRKSAELTSSLLPKTEKKLDSIEKRVEKIETRKQRGEPEDESVSKAIIKDLEALEADIKRLEDAYSRIASARGIELRGEGADYTAKLRAAVRRWQQLKGRVDAAGADAHRQFVAAHGKAVVALAEADVRLTRALHLAPTPLDKLATLKELDGVEQELYECQALVENADRLAFAVSTVAGVSDMVAEYRALYADVRTRLDLARAEVVGDVDSAVQVDTLKWETDASLQVDTLTSKETYRAELALAVKEASELLEALRTALLQQPKDNASGEELANAAKDIAKAGAKPGQPLELAKHLSELLLTECDSNEEEAMLKEVESLSLRYEDLLAQAKKRELQINNLRLPHTASYALTCEHESGRLTCPLCSERNWKQLDNDLWRLEQWLQFAEATEDARTEPPEQYDALEDAIQDHREFLLDLDSHKSIVVSLNVVGSHVAAHASSASAAETVRNRLAADNQRWDRACERAAVWQKKLQWALVHNQQFHDIVVELVGRLGAAERDVRAREPLALGRDAPALLRDLRQFSALRDELRAAEPRVLALHDAAQLLRAEGAPPHAHDVCRRLGELRLRLQSLRKLCGVYALKLGAALARHPQASARPALAAAAAAAVPQLMDDEEEQISTLNLPPLDENDAALSEDADMSRLQRGLRFVCRVARASLPFQALLLLLLGAAALTPPAHSDCRPPALGLEPVLRYPDGPPPL